MDKILSLKKIIEESNNIVVFSGAGLSTNSGIPDFRSADGIYNQELDISFRPEEVISHSFYVNYPEYFYRFYFDKLVYEEARPNNAHYYFAELEKEGKVSAVITQNIDNLHQMAGSINVVELHGSTKRNYCVKCNAFYDIDEISHECVPYCHCGGMIKPDVVLYEEGLNESDIDKAIRYIRSCDTLIIVGTSLSVYPAAGFVNYFRGKNLVLINKSKTPYDYKATLVINEDISKVIDKLQS